MKYYTLLLVLLAGGLQAQDDAASKILSGKDVKAVTGDLFYCAAGDYTCDIVYGTDSFNLFDGEYRYKGSGLFFKANEVSIAEYRLFLAESGDTAMVYDSLVYLSDFPYFFYNTSMEKFYFNHVKYDDYPIVGVTYENAEAFCKWQSKKLNALLTAEGKSGEYEIRVRLPSLDEWEQLAQNKPMDETAYKKTGARDHEKKKKIKTRSAKSNWYDKGEYLANIGPVIDQNGYYIKQFTSDGALFPVRAGMFPYYGQPVYNVIGNVAEFVSTPSGIIINQIETSLRDSVPGNDRAGFSSSDSASAALIKKLQQAKQNIISKYGEDAYIVKGGSWYHGAFYTQPGVNIYVKPGEAHSWVGFRPVYVVVKK